MKQAMGPVLPAAPTIGDAFHDTSINAMYCCVTDGVCPPVHCLSSFSKRYINDIWSNFNTSYNKCFVDIMEIEWDGTIHNTWTKQQFAGTADITAFVRANVEESPTDPGTPKYNIHIRFYDIIDPTIPQLNKLYGINTFYHMLTAKANNHRLGNDGNLWSGLAINTWFADLCNQGLGFPGGHAYVLGDEKAIWLARNRKTRYGLPHVGFNMSNGNDRSIWNDDLGIFQNAFAVPINSYINPAVGLNHLFCSVDLTAPLTTWDWHRVGPGGAPNPGHMMEPNYSTVALYPVIHSMNPDYRALMLKPVGIDAVGVNWYDQTKYDLYAEYIRKGTTPRIRHITVFAGMPDAPGSTYIARNLIWIPKSSWQYTQEDQRLGPNGVIPGYMTRFFLRDKVTNLISSLTPNRIVLGNRRRDASLAYQVDDC